jgi:enediyne biosynthesis protein E4
VTNVGRFLRRQSKRLAAIVIAVGLCALARNPSASRAERSALASRFHFTSAHLPEVPGAERRQVRPVHPSLDRISAWISSVGAAVAIADIDGNGLADDACWVEPATDQANVAPLPGTKERYRPFFLDAGARFDRRSMAPMGCLPGDWNEDGRVDLMVYYWGRTPLLFSERDGRWQPQEITPVDERWYTNSAVSADFDGDGHLDVMVSNYFADGAHILDTNGTGRQYMQDSMSRSRNSGRAHLFLGSGAAQFRDVTAALPPEAEYGWTLALGACDLDGDLLPEIYIANDFGPDRLLHNRSRPGQLQFAALVGEGGIGVPNSKVLGRDSFKGMGVDFGDLNGDGLPDMFVSNIAAEYALEESHFAFISTGATERMKQGVAPYVDRSESLGLARSSWGWETRLADFDNDGVLEALQATGFFRGKVNRWPELQELAMSNDGILKYTSYWPRFQAGDDLSGHSLNPFYVRQGDRYVDVAPEIGLEQPQVSRGIAVADIDGDGDLDFVVANQWGPTVLNTNQCDGKCGRFLGLHLMLPTTPGEATPVARAGHPSRDQAARPAVGAFAAVRLPDGRRLVAQVDGGSGHSGKKAPEVHFGLGKVPDGPLPVELRWLDGSGAPHSAELKLEPGWHTVRLGWPKAGAR